MIAADWSLSRIAMQLLVEERMGRSMREARASEDATFDVTRREVAR